MKKLAVLVLAATAAAAQTFPFDKGHGPEWDSGTPLESSVRCRNCHDKDSTPEESLYMPYDGWVSSMMGNSQRDPLFRAALAVANQDVPGVGQWCLRCHSPQAYVRGHVLPADGGALDNLDLEGVTCDVCHRSIVLPTEPGAPYVGNAQLFFEVALKKYGPYANVYSPAHDGEQSAFTGSSELCGQCHSVHNPIGPWRALDGGLLGPRFPLDTTYEEWKQSSFSRLPRDAGFASCADCHLPLFTGPDGGTGYRVGKGIGVPLRTNPRQHALAGGNVWGLDAVQAANPALEPDLAAQFAQTKKFTLENLRGAARLELSVPSNTTAVVRVTNLTGHKLPTGYADGRRIWLQLSADSLVFTGAFDGGALINDSQLRVYEARHGRAAIGASEHLALHDAVVKDSRIPPAQLLATAQTQPVGVTWFEAGDGGLKSYDEAAFTVPISPSLPDGAKVKISARLFYQSTTPEYVEFLAKENRSDDAGRVLLDIYNATGRGAPIEMAVATAELTVSRPAVDAGSGPGKTGGCGCGAGPGLAGVAALLVLLARRRTSRR